MIFINQSVGLLLFIASELWLRLIKDQKNKFQCCQWCLSTTWNNLLDINVLKR